MTGPVFVIANPAAGGGRGAKVLEKVRTAVKGERSVTVKTTHAAGEETTLAAEAIAAGARVIVAVGGDGTWSKVAAALLQAGHPPSLALIAAGTGNDFAKSVGAPARDVARTLALIKAGTTRTVDAGTVDGRIFLVCCGFGFDTAVLRRMQSVRRLRGSARYVCAALRELSAYDGFDVEIVNSGAGGADQQDVRRLLLLVVANARHYGGAFTIAPNANVADGMLDGIALSDVRTLARARLLVAATRGLHVWSEAVNEYQRRGFDLRFADPPLYNVDGDVYQATSRTVRVDCLPAALEVVAPAAS